MKCGLPAIAFAIAFLMGSALSAQDLGKVLILRNTGDLQSNRKCQLMEDDVPLADLSDRDAVLLELPAGRHTLQTRLKSGPIMGYPVTCQAGAYSFYELELYRAGGLLPGYRFRLVPLSPKRLLVFLRDEDWLRRDLGQGEYETLCKMLNVRPLVGQSR